MSLDPAYLAKLASFDPSMNAIASFFLGFSRLDPAMAKMLLDGFDEQVLAKMAAWSSAYAKSLNALTTQPDVTVEPGYEVDFDKVMAGTVWQGEKLDWSTLETAQNQMVKALKANNYLDAIKMGMSLAQVLVPVPA